MAYFAQRDGGWQLLENHERVEGCPTFRFWWQAVMWGIRSGYEFQERWAKEASRLEGLAAGEDLPLFNS